MAEEKKNAKPKKPTAKKRELQNAKRRLLNRSFKSKIHTATRTYEKTVKEKDLEAAQKNLCLLYSLLDRAVKKNIFKLNKARRLKSKLASQLTP